MRFLAIVVALAIAVVGWNNPAGAVTNRYAKWHLGQPFGYRDLRITPGRWKIRGLSYYAGNDFTAAMALHRVAAHAKAEGFTRFFAVSLKNTCAGIFMRPNVDGSPCGGTLDEEVDVVAIGVTNTAQLPPCEEKGRWATNCRIFIVEDVLATAGRFLGVSKSDQDREIVELSGSLGRP